MTAPVTDDSSTRTLVALVGNPRAGSRTRSVAELLTRRLAKALQPVVPTTVRVIDLAELGGAVLDGGHEVDEALEVVRTASVLVIATPVYKASFTGLLKAFLDRIRGGELAGIVAVPLTVAGAPLHHLVADVHLRPVLVELGAATPTAAFTLEEADLPEVESVVDKWIDSQARFVQDLVVGRPHVVPA